jgi:outer membrane biosynthesis protein TonB
MNQYLSRVALLLAAVFVFVGCESLKPDPTSKRKGANTRSTQTGTNIPRAFRSDSRTARTRADKPKPKKEKKAAQPKPTPTPKPKREKPARGPVDEDVVTRGGFR